MLYVRILLRCVLKMLSNLFVHLIHRIKYDKKLYLNHSTDYDGYIRHNHSPSCKNSKTQLMPESLYKKSIL